MPEELKYTSDNNFGMGRFGLDFYTKLQALAPWVSFEHYGVHYPAIPVDNPDGALELMHFGVAYQDSVDIGNSDIQTELARKDINCPAEKFILEGYSQGADSVDGAITAIAPALQQKILAVVLFGDPHFNANDSDSDRSTYDASHFGVLGTHDRDEAWEQVVRFPVFDYCHNGDPICNVSNRIQIGPAIVFPRNIARIYAFTQALGEGYWAEHENYDTRGDTLNAALAVRALLNSSNGF